MRSYRVIAASVNIHAGVLGLAHHQARTRLHRLKPLGHDLYEVTLGPVAFKRGETFEYGGMLPKEIVVCLTCEPIADTPEDEPFHPQGAEQATSLCMAFPLIDPELFRAPDDTELLVEAAPDDGVVAVVAEKPPKRKKGARGAKPPA